MIFKNLLKNNKYSNILNFPLIILFLVILGCRCGTSVDKSNIPERASLPIDGIYNIFYVDSKVDIKIEKGRAYIYESNSSLYPVNTIIIKDIIPISKNSYTGNWMVSGESKVTLNVLSEYEIALDLPLQADQKLTRISIDNEQAFATAHNDFSNAQAVDVVATNTAQGSENKKINTEEDKPKVEDKNFGLEIISFKEERVKASEEEQNLVNGAELSIQKSRTIEHKVILNSRSETEISGDVEISESASAGVILANAELSAKIRAGIKYKIENLLSRSFSETETNSQTVRLDGNKGRRWKVIWHDRIRTGIARYSDENGKIYDIPYKFTVGTELDVERLK